MMLLTKQNLKDLPPLYATDGKEDALAPVKFFTPDSSWTWYAVEFDPAEGLFYGLACGHEDEWGYFSLAELENARGPLGLRIERDRWYTPVTKKQLNNGVRP